MRKSSRVAFSRTVSETLSLQSAFTLICRFLTTVAQTSFILTPLTRQLTLIFRSPAARMSSIKSTHSPGLMSGFAGSTTMGTFGGFAGVVSVGDGVGELDGLAVAVGVVGGVGVGDVVGAGGLGVGDGVGAGGKVGVTGFVGGSAGRQPFRQIALPCRFQLRPSCSPAIGGMMSPQESPAVALGRHTGPACAP